MSSDFAGDNFFSVIAQIIPVMLLALAIEANVFRSVPRARRGTAFAVKTGAFQRLLEGGTILVLLAAEVQALAVIQDRSAGCDPTLSNVAIAWGFATIGAIAWRGTGRARPTIDIEAVSENADGILVRIGIGNVFGDRPIDVELNTLLGPNVRAFDSDSVATRGKELPLPLSASVEVDGRSITCRYSGVPLRLAAGDAGVSYTLLKLGGPEAIVVVRLDHVDLPDGRVELAAWVRPGPSVEIVGAPTA